MDKDLIALAMNLLDMVTWDRCVVSESSGCAYGWIARDDGRSDFVLLRWDGDTIGYTTSSAMHSREIGRRLGCSGETHRDCERVEDVFGALVERAVRQEKGA